MLRLADDDTADDDTADDDTADSEGDLFLCRNRHNIPIIQIL